MSAPTSSQQPPSSTANISSTLEFHLRLLDALCKNVTRAGCNCGTVVGDNKSPVNVTPNPPQETFSGEDDDSQAFLYIVFVLMFYAFSIVILMVKYIKREREGVRLEYYYDEFVKREAFQFRLFDKTGRPIPLPSHPSHVLTPVVKPDPAAEIEPEPPPAPGSSGMAMQSLQQRQQQEQDSIDSSDSDESKTTMHVAVINEVNPTRQPPAKKAKVMYTETNV